ncbi:unnamed protein product [Linum trigynum]|uniref:Uncharacterized protein n=1 Tax=Linum trigynum TaxID=586398 RepID=A0AAV2DLU2_9ROSI
MLASRKKQISKSPTTQNMLKLDNAHPWSLSPTQFLELRINGHKAATQVSAYAKDSRLQSNEKKRGASKGF